MRELIAVVLAPLVFSLACASDDAAPSPEPAEDGGGGGNGGNGPACHVDCFTDWRKCRDGVVYEVHYGMPCTGTGLSICTEGLPVESCELGCALNGEDCLSADHPENLCRVGDPTGAACGTCILSVEELCRIGSSSRIACDLRPISVCSNVPGGFPESWERGCGLLRSSVSAVAPFRRVSIWDETTLKLVYHWDDGRRSDGCVSETRVGLEPQCDEWSDACAPATDP
ncbi:MAG: hypothetical protein M3020_13275 [Myxococcota bacterium]|jgi:hypothetical protein|nr:hypothetical protein [Myxococcota bacterium]